jgi:hypothetical protein
MKRVIAGLVAALALLGACQSVATPPQAEGGTESAMFDPPTGPLSEAEIWRVDPDDNITHIQSGATCPGLWGGLKRDRLTIFRPDGMDVGCNYVGIDNATAMTLYVFTSAHGGLDSEMKVAIDSMRARQPVAKETPFYNPSSNGGYKTYTLAYANADGTPMRTSLLLGQVNGGWLLKIRLTCRESDARKAEEVAGLAMMGQADRLRTRPVPRTAKPDPI